MRSIDRHVRTADDVDAAAGAKRRVVPNTAAVDAHRPTDSVDATAMGTTDVVFTCVARGGRRIEAWITSESRARAAKDFTAHVSSSTERV